MELRQLEYFVAVAEHLHFGRAAASLGVGQPTVSQQLARLERELGVTLLDRSSRTVRLSAAGARLLPEARAVLAGVERARSAAAGPASTEHVLRLGSTTGLGERLDAVLAALRELAPQTSVRLITAPTRARLERVRAGQLDASFVRGLDDVPGLELVPVWEDELVVAIPADCAYATDPAVDLGDLAGMTLHIVARARNPPLVDLLMTACHDAGFEPRIGDHPGSLDASLALIGTGTRAWTVLYAARAAQIRSSRVVFRPLRSPLVMPTALALPAGAGSLRFADLLRACGQVASIGAGDRS